MTKQELDYRIDNWFSRNWDYYVNEVATNICTGKMAQHTGDLCIHCFEEFSKKTDAQKQQMLDDNKIINFLLFCASFQLRSSTSPFYAKYRKKSMDKIPLYDNTASGAYYNQHDRVTIDDYYECMMECLGEDSEVIDWYEKKILSMKYLDKKTYIELVNEYGFSQASLKTHIQTAQNKIEKYCNNKIEK